MDFVKQILQFFKERVDLAPSGFCSFASFLEDDQSEYIVTVYAESNGYLVFSVFSTDEWAMVNDICELTSRNVEDIVREISDNNEIINIVVDPREID